MAWHIGELLIQKKLISWEQLQDALEEQKKSKELVGEILIRKRYISENLFYKALADQYQIRFIDLKRTRVNPKAIALVPRSIAEKYTLMPVELSGGAVVIGISNPRLWPEEELRELTHMGVKPVLCLPGDISDAIKENYTPVTA